MPKTVFITGATSGIGRACAEKFAEQGYDLVLTGRRKDRLDALQQAVSQAWKVNVSTLCFDVQDRTAVFQSIETFLAAEDTPVNILINNAGLAAGRDPVDRADVDDWDAMMHTNVDGLLYVTRALLPAIKKSRGHIINLGSVAGKSVYENGSVYCASKFAVDALSRSMRIDLIKYGIKVTSINPGAVETEFSLVRYKGDEEKAAATYKGLEPLSANDVADAIFYCAALPENVCINDLTITCLRQADTSVFYKGPFVV